MPTLTDWELWAVANRYIEDHGAEAALKASDRERHLREIGDREGATAWRMIGERIGQLQAEPEGLGH